MAARPRATLDIVVGVSLTSAGNRLIADMASYRIRSVAG
jgi:hypothetical protein